MVNWKLLGQRVMFKVTKHWRPHLFARSTVSLQRVTWHQLNDMRRKRYEDGRKKYRLEHPERTTEKS